jgi:hypothetical protein
MSDNREPFISRWSRRKLESAKSAEGPKADAPTPPGASVPAPGVAAPQAPVQTELPSIDSLRGLASEYREFLAPGVDANLRRAALKKLFRDPHFNVMDGLDVYIDDYSKPDPIPDAMLRTLAHAKGLLFGEEKKETQALPGGPAAQSLPAAPGAADVQAQASSVVPTEPTEQNETNKA